MALLFIAPLSKLATIMYVSTETIIFLFSSWIQQVSSSIILIVDFTNGIIKKQVEGLIHNSTISSNIFTSGYASYKISLLLLT